MRRLALLPLAMAVWATSARAETHRLVPKVGHPTFAVRPPVLTVQPGDVVESESLWGDWYERPGGRWPGEVGPIAIAGAEPGDTLVVEVLKVRPNRDTAVSTQGGRFGALVPDEGTAFLNETFPRGRYVWRIDRQRGTGTLDLPGQLAQDDHGAAAADARTGGHRARGCGGVRRALAGAVRRQHGRLGRAGGHDGVPARVPPGRAVLLRRRPRAPGRRGGLRLRAGDGDGRHLPLRAAEKEDDRLAAARRRRTHHGRGQRAAALGRAAHRLRGADRLARGRTRLQQGRGLPGRVAARGGARRPDGGPALHGGREVPEAVPAGPVLRGAAGRSRRSAGRPELAGSGEGAHPRPRRRASPRRGGQGARTAPAAAERPDPRRLPRAAGGRGAAGGPAADPDLRVLPGVPRIPGLHLASRSTRNATPSSPSRGRSRVTVRAASTCSTPACPRCGP